MNQQRILPNVSGPELCLRIDGQTFGVSFFGLQEARRGALMLVRGKGQLEIFDRRSGTTLEQISDMDTDSFDIQKPVTRTPGAEVFDPGF